MKKPSRKSLVKKLDKVFSLYIRKRDGNKCVLCGSCTMPQCGHLFSRVAYATRWHERNAACNCASCNIKHEYNPYPFVRWSEDKYGREMLDELQKMWNKPRIISNGELADMITVFEQKLKELE